LLHKSGSFGLHVKVEDIDWDAYRKQSGEVTSLRQKQLL